MSCCAAFQFWLNLLCSPSSTEWRCPVGAPGAETSAGAQLPDEQLPGSVSGTIIDQTGTAVVGARVRLTCEGQSPIQEMTTGDDGQFSFANIAPGPFHLTIMSEGFSTQSSSGILHSGEAYIVPQIALVIAIRSQR